MVSRLSAIAVPLMAAALVAVPVSASGLTPPPAAAVSASKAINGYKTVGKLFVTALGVQFSCTATVIGPDIILTAAHCFKGELDGITYTTSGWSFAPMWHDNKSPYGRWSVRSVYLMRTWISKLDPKYDYAVVVLKPRAGHDIAHYTGQDSWNAKLSLKPRQSRPVRIVGIPQGSAKALISVTRAVAVDVRTGFEVLRASTPGFGNGTSGGPWFDPFSPRTDTGTVIGVTGGYEAGGAKDSPSYADFLTAQFAGLMSAATTGIAGCNRAGDCRYWPSAG
jgi:V8-like Glu-specific endopeptidase